LEENGNDTNKEIEMKSGMAFCDDNVIRWSKRYVQLILYRVCIMYMKELRNKRDYNTKTL